MAETCGHAGVMEFNGDVYSCDHFVFPEYKLGNIYTQSLIEMMNSPRQIAFGQNKRNALHHVKSVIFYLPATESAPKTGL